MWRILRVGNQNYNFKVRHDVRKRKVFVYMFAFETLWNSEVNHNEIVEEMQKLNPMLRFEDDDIIPEVIGLFEANREDVECCVEREGSQINLSLTSTRDDVEYVFKATLHPSDGETHYRILIKNLMMGHKLSVGFLKGKDDELQEFKMSGATTRKSIETPLFDENSITFPPKVLKAVLSNTEDVFDGSIISYLNQIEPLVKEKSPDDLNVEVSQNVQQLGKANGKELTNFSNVPILEKNTKELNQKSEEKIRNLTFHKMDSIKVQKSNRPIKKLKGL